MNEILKTAKNCRHYAMCKIDFLDSGVCLQKPDNLTMLMDYEMSTFAKAVLKLQVLTNVSLR